MRAQGEPKDNERANVAMRISINSETDVISSSFLPNNRDEVEALFIISFMTLRFE